MKTFTHGTFWRYPIWLLSCQVLFMFLESCKFSKRLLVAHVSISWNFQHEIFGEQPLQRTRLGADLQICSSSLYSIHQNICRVDYYDHRFIQTYEIWTERIHPLQCWINTKSSQSIYIYIYNFWWISVKEKKRGPQGVWLEVIASLANSLFSTSVDGYVLSRLRVCENI